MENGSAATATAPPAAGPPPFPPLPHSQAHLGAAFHAAGAAAANAAAAAASGNSVGINPSFQEALSRMGRPFGISVRHSTAISTTRGQTLPTAHVAQLNISTCQANEVSFPL